MERGRLIRIGKFPGDTKGVAYIVAIADPAGAMALIRGKVANPEDDVEDLGRVSEALLVAMNLQPGQYKRA
jgi:hypothetical protein